MITREEVIGLMRNMESDRIERTISFREDKLGPAICSLSNDFANHKIPGYILIGITDEGVGANMKIRDDDLQKIGNVKSNGNVLPQPSFSVSEVFNIDGSDIVVIEVYPSLYPPVRFQGRCYIRIGPRVSIANETDERRLTEKRTSTVKSFDARPCPGSKKEDLQSESFKLLYLPLAVDKEALETNNRSEIEQMGSLRMFDISYDCPTNAGILVLGKNPLQFFPSAFIQYVRVTGDSFTSGIDFEKRFSGPLISLLKILEDFLEINIFKKKPVRVESFQENIIYNYPFWALRELTMNAVMHRDYESNAPIYIYEFNNRIEIQNSGSLFGEVNLENFPNASDYRNQIITEAMKTLRYVNRFNFGIRNAQYELEKNGNGFASFDLSLKTKFQVSIPINKNWK